MLLTPRNVALMSGAAQTPFTVFGSALKVWFDDDDYSTMWQDTAATVPAEVGQRLAKQFCKVNPAFYRQQGTLSQRPYLRQLGSGHHYLECDGSDDGMATPNLDLSAYNKVAMFTAVRVFGTATTAVLVEFSTVTGSNPGTFAFVFQAGNQNIDFRSRGSSAIVASAKSFAAPPVTFVAGGVADIPADYLVTYVNDVPGLVVSTDQGTGNYGNFPLYFFRRAGASLPFSGWEVGGCMLVAGIVPTAEQIAWVHAYFNSRAGAY